MDIYFFNFENLKSINLKHYLNEKRKDCIKYEQ